MTMAKVNNSNGKKEAKKPKKEKPKVSAMAYSGVGKVGVIIDGKKEN
jgi:hypothetical protein